MATFHGKNGMVYLEGTAAGAVKLIEARSWSIDIDRELDEDMSFGDDWKTQLSGVLSWTVEVEINASDSQVSPFEAATSMATKRVYIYPISGVTARYYYGFIWPKLSVSASTSGVARGTLKGDGDGQLAAN